MGRSRGLEPPTSGTTNRRSNHLSYDRHMPRPGQTCLKAVTVIRARTADLRTATHRSRPSQAGASVLHKALSKESENCLFSCYAQEYFAHVMPLPASAPNLNSSIMNEVIDSVTERLVANPRAQRVPHPKIELFQLKDFIDEELRASLIAMIDQDRRPSTIADENGDDYFRTSETCDLPRDHPATQRLEEHLLWLNGINPDLGEPCQGQRYDVGQEFKAHTDYFAPGSAAFEKFCKEAGQRTWTFMIYLNAVEAGGATRFKTVNKTFKPEPGKLVCWNNKRPDGSLNPNTLHHGMKVRKGMKYVITKWYRERPWPW